MRSHKVTCRWILETEVRTSRICISLLLLSWLSAVGHAFAWAKRSSVVARVIAPAIWNNICGPIAANALPVYPGLTLPHPGKV